MQEEACPTPTPPLPEPTIAAPGPNVIEAEEKAAHVAEAKKVQAAAAVDAEKNDIQGGKPEFEQSCVCCSLIA